MTAEVCAAGKRYEPVLPQNTAFVGCTLIERRGGRQSTFNVCGGGEAGAKEIAEMLGYTFVKIEIPDCPVQTELYAYVDESGEEARILSACAGMKMLEIDAYGVKLTVTA